MAAVPDTDTFSLQDVVDAVEPTTNDLNDCISDAIEDAYDTTYYTFPATSLLEFRNYYQDPNTFIGGGGVAIPNVAALVSETSLTTSDIFNFNIDADNNLTFHAKVPYTINGGMFSLDDNITYYLDEKGLCTSIGTDSFHNSSPLNNLIVVFPAVTSCGNRILGGGGAGSRQTTGLVCLPQLSPIGATATANENNFSWLVCYDDVYVSDVNETSNTGSTPDEDISNPIASNIGSFVKYSANTNSPGVATLTTGSKTSTSVNLNWTAVSHTNTIEHYLIFVDYTYFGSTSGTSLNVTGLTASTEYSFRILTVDSEGNSSDFYVTEFLETTNA